VKIYIITRTVGDYEDVGFVDIAKSPEEALSICQNLEKSQTSYGDIVLHEEWNQVGYYWTAPNGERAGIAPNGGRAWMVLYDLLEREV
jgi:hypothetical protein